MRVVESVLPFVITWTLFVAVLHQIFPIPKNLFFLEFCTIMIALAATMFLWLFVLCGANNCIREKIKNEAGCFRFFWCMPDLVHVIANRAETELRWRIAVIALSPLLPAWIGFLATVVIIDLLLTIACACGYSWKGRQIAMIPWLILGFVCSPIWGWMSLIYFAIAGLAFTLVCSLVAWPTMPFSEYIERRAARCS